MRIFKDYLVTTLIMFCSLISPVAYADLATIENNCRVERDFYLEAYKLIQNGEKLNSAIEDKYNSRLILSKGIRPNINIYAAERTAKTSNVEVLNRNYNYCVSGGMRTERIVEDSMKFQKSDEWKSFSNQSHDNEINNNYGSAGYDPSASKGGYDPSASKGDSSYAPSVNKPLIGSSIDQESPDKLCKSYGLKKGTSTYANCMIKTREQNLLLQKTQEETNERIRQNETAQLKQEEDNKNRELDRRSAEKLQREAAQRQIDAETEKNIRELNRLEQQRLQKEEAKKAEDNAADWRAIGAQGKLMMQPGYQWGDTEQSYNLRMQEQKAQKQQQRLINEINRPRTCTGFGNQIICQ